MNVSNQSKAEFVHDVFADIADRYDVMNTVLSFEQHKRWRAFAMRKIQAQPGWQALDVAAGTADWTLSLAEAVGVTGQAVGVDFCEEMLVVGRRKIQKAGYPPGQIGLQFGDAMQLEFADNSFHLATIGFALRNVPDVATVLQEMTRVVKPGGLVVSLELSKPESPLFRALYYFYFYRILPLIGALAIGKKAPYAWLPQSLTDFPNRKQLEQVFRDVGLTDVESYPLTGGVAALHIGRKVGA